MYVPSVAAAGSSLGPAVERHLDSAFRAFMGDRCYISDSFVRLATGEPHPLGNFALLSDASDLESADEAVTPLCGSSAPAACLIPGAAPQELDALLVGKGFVHHGAMPAMAVDIAAVEPVEPPAGCELVRVSDAETAAAWTEVFAQGYELPGPVAQAFAPPASGSESDVATQFFLVLSDGRPAATSALCLLDGLAGVYCVSTIPQERRKGLGAYATAEALRRGGEAGYHVGVLQSSAAGYSIYKKLGFEDCGGIAFYIRMPG